MRACGLFILEGILRSARTRQMWVMGEGQIDRILGFRAAVEGPE